MEGVLTGYITEYVANRETSMKTVTKVPRINFT